MAGQKEQSMANVYDTKVQPLCRLGLYKDVKYPIRGERGRETERKKSVKSEEPYL